jgi:hypothetical protein
MKTIWKVTVKGLREPCIIGAYITLYAQRYQTKVLHVILYENILSIEVLKYIISYYVTLR